MSVTGFDFQALNRRYMTQPANDAASYGVNIISAPAGLAWRCIGAYHLRPEENRRRHNVFVEVLDETGKRDRNPVINWTWWIDAPTQTRKLDKPDSEPAADIPIDKGATVTVRINGGGILSDSVGNLHSRHNDEGSGNTWGHHSYYLVFQRRGAVVVPPPVDPPDPPPSTDLDQRVAALETEVKRLSANIDAIWLRLDQMDGGK
jgi:hypothetical protein